MGMSKQISVLTGVLFAKVCLGLLVDRGVGRRVVLGRGSVAVNEDDVILFHPANKRECPARPSSVRAVKFNKVVL